MIALLFLLSCNEKPSLRTEVTLPKSVSVNLDSIQTRPFLKNPISLVVNDSFLVVSNFKVDTLFRVFSQPGCNYLGWFGMNGKGPREFLGASPQGVRFYRDQLQVDDRKKIYYLQFPERSIHNNFIIKESISKPSNLIHFNQVFRLDKALICGVHRSRFSAQHSIDTFNINTSEIGSFLEYPDFGFEVPGKDKRAVYHFGQDVKPDRNMFALVYRFYPLLRIVGKKGKVLHESYVKGLPEQIEFKNLGTRNTNLGYGVRYYNYIRVTSRYIYLRYDPRKGKKVTERRFESTPIGQLEVHIFKWNCQPVARMKLKRGTLAFAPSSDDRYLYCTNMNSIDKIYRYDLRKLLNPEHRKP
ncbi:MAG: hypothetical protein KGY74_11055 [Candidatus Cloacimonetes bacterium]|nr:hypothetical protein [Candidatus Cloacimonadota bacterium]